MAQPQLQPLRMGTRQRIQKIGVIPFVAGQPGSLPLPRVGLLSRIFIEFRGTVTKGGGALADSSPWGLLSRVRLNVNIGAANIIDVSGFGLYAMQSTLRGGFSPMIVGTSQTAAGIAADVFAAPSGAGTSPVAFSLIVPVAMNQGAQMQLGLVQLQAPELSASLDVTFGQITDYAGDCTAVAGSLHVFYEYFEVPDLSRYALPPLSLVRTLEDTTQVLNTGETRYTVPRMGTLLTLSHIIRLNGARSDAVDSFALQINKSDTPYQIERQLMRQRMAYENHATQDVGVYHYNLFNSYEVMNQGDLRDAIDSEENSVTDAIVNVNSAAVLGSANNSVSTVRRVFQMLEG